MARDSRLLVCLVIVALVVLGLYFVAQNTKHESYDYGLIPVPLPPSQVPDIEFVREPDDVSYTSPDGVEMIPAGDLSLSPGFGIGEGTIGFGRNGSGFMA